MSRTQQQQLSQGETKKIIKDRNAHKDMHGKLSTAIVNSFSHGSPSGAAVGKLKKDIQEQARILFRAVSKCSTKGLFVKSNIGAIICTRNGCEHCAAVIKGINKEHENLRIKEKWIIIEELWSEHKHA